MSEVRRSTRLARKTSSNHLEGSTPLPDRESLTPTPGEKQKSSIATTKTKERASDHDGKPARQQALIVAAVLMVTVLVGTTYSSLIYTTGELSFRSRLPTKISNTLPLVPKLAAASSLPNLPGAHTSSAGALDDVLGHLKTITPYFARKSNLFNQYFVKKAWGWTTLVWFFHLVTVTTHEVNAKGGNAQAVQARAHRHVYRELKRYTAATIIWLLLTTWFFGPSVIDRIMVASGGVCLPSAVATSMTDQSVLHAYNASQPLPHSFCFSRGLHAAGSSPMASVPFIKASSKLSPSEATLAAQHQALRRQMKAQGIRTYWQGGQDISGHLFLLSMSVIFLMPSLHLALRNLARITSLSHDRQQAATQLAAVASSAAVIALVSLWWWMMLMTSVYFHTPLEKVIGITFGLLSGLGLNWIN
ncbi:uncharacterized protein L969DRAFT_50945 [Mixia osmundae IAM 14324]|uniref:Uncharacterized protein n=1 Tax=Mixia osmundae (strain CBS 9802 / IAM 14324 / JCM 22182 / KY 12970) TaxID=764103 RepID=G7EAN2_MIXOS|nr:uncharacterized protein L969DRAFT_50945 [Mixia osmundae IAM 14324]KEI38209.1 hypothetical protein L969DRAFT_50945 [Mixia osmundae IAM 14324]GAA99892.1 hypothetical protein E5Q_06595 [Mixia osmundae IAM 14324]